MKIAVIGAGISGLVAAYRLCSEHDITVFEANDYPGGHTNTVEVELDGERHAIDTGFIVFNDWTYPNFIALLDELGVASRSTTMSFSVRDDRTRPGIQRPFAEHAVRPASQPAAAELLSNAGRHPAIQSRGPASRHQRQRRDDRRRVPASAPLLGGVRQVLSAADGRGDLVLPDRDVRPVSDSVHRRLLPQSRLAQCVSAADMARRRGWFTDVRASDDAQLSRSNSAANAGAKRAAVSESRRRAAARRAE